MHWKGEFGGIIYSDGEQLALFAVAIAELFLCLNHLRQTLLSDGHARREKRADERANAVQWRFDEDVMLWSKLAAAQLRASLKPAGFIANLAGNPFGTPEIGAVRVF